MVIEQRLNPHHRRRNRQSCSEWAIKCLGKTRLTRVAFGIAPKQVFAGMQLSAHTLRLRKVPDREDAFAHMPDACATRRATGNHCAHSSNAAGSPRRWARTSPAK